MAIIIKTDNPSALLKAIQKAIKDGNIRTWEEDEGGDFTHKTSDKQWYKKAWMRPKEYTSELKFGIVSQDTTPLSVEVYAIYHGRFIEMLLAHFDKKFDSISSTALLSSYDYYI